MAPPAKRCENTICARCHKPFKMGERVTPIYIVSKVGYNMATKDAGAWLLEEFELGHISCADPGLDSAIITG